MFCPRQLFRALHYSRPRRWLSAVQHDSSNILHDPQSHPVMQQPTLTQNDSSNTLHDPPVMQQSTHTQNDSSNILHDPQSNPVTQQPTLTQKDSSNILHDPLSNPVTQQPTHLTFTNQILTAVNGGNFPSGFQIAAKMKSQGISPDILTYNALMHAVAKDGNSLLSWAILDDMILFGIQPTVTTFTHLIDAQRRVPTRYLWFAWDKMIKLSIKPNAQIYTSIITTFIHCGNLEMAIQYLFAMKSQNIVPELSAVQGVIILAAESGYPRLAFDLATYFEDNSHRRVGDDVWVACLYSAAQALYIEGVTTCWKHVVKELDITPNEGVCIAVLNTAARHGVPDLATDVLRVLKLSGIAWQEYHLAALIEAFCRNNQLKEALITLHIMRSNNIIPLPSTSVSIIDSIVDVESLDSTWTIIDEIHKAKSGLDIDALKVVIQASVLLKDLQRAVGFYKSLSGYDLVPDLAIFNTLLDGCIDAQHRQLGDVLLADMKKAGVKPNGETYEKIIQLCLTQDVYEDAFFYLEEMKAADFVPTQTVYEALVMKCRSMGDTRMDIALEEMLECGYEMPKHFKKVASSPSANEPEMTMGLDKGTRDYIETGGLRREELS